MRNQLRNHFPPMFLLACFLRADDRAAVAAQVPAAAAHRGGDGGRSGGGRQRHQDAELHLPRDPVHSRHRLPEHWRKLHTTPPHPRPWDLKSDLKQITSIASLRVCYLTGDTWFMCAMLLFFFRSRNWKLTTIHLQKDSETITIRKYLLVMRTHTHTHILSLQPLCWLLNYVPNSNPRPLKLSDPS